MADRLESARAALEHQKAWFADMREQVAGGAPLALVNADAPQELFRAAGVPYVVNQWWSSIISAKRLSGRYLGALRERGLPDDDQQYNALPLAEALTGGDDRPWGGLPLPSVVLVERTGDSLHRMFDLWQSELGVPVHVLESAAAGQVPVNWWDLMPWQWEQAVGRERLDLLERELEALADRVEALTGRPLSLDSLAEIMRLSNEQAEWNRRTRALIATAERCPVRVNDTIPAVMIPQWHRGTQWAVDAARRLHDEVRDLVDAGTAVADERHRLMWIGRGLWFDMDFYRRFEESHGAVFVWSMYLALAADAYARYGGRPLRAVAARFAAFRDQMYTPPWSVEWYVDQARRHRVDGVVHLVSSDSRSSWFVTHALRRASIPVYEIHADNSDARALDAELLQRQVADWIEREL